jgi:hypothetical protein
VVKRDFIIFAKKRMDQSAKMTAARPCCLAQRLSRSHNFCECIGSFSGKALLRRCCVEHGAKMCEDDTRNKGKAVRKEDCVVCTPSRLCTHGLRTCNQCSPGITDRKITWPQDTKRKKGFFYGYLVAAIWRQDSWLSKRRTNSS